MKMALSALELTAPLFCYSSDKLVVLFVDIPFSDRWD